LALVYGCSYWIKPGVGGTESSVGRSSFNEDTDENDGEPLGAVMEEDENNSFAGDSS
jgi:hypothetical protein